jgi:hypothetical protein
MLPRLRTYKLALLAILVCGPLAAQSVITISPEQCHWHSGDNPAWTASGFDDSGWQPLSTWKRQTSDENFWVRCHAGLGELSTLAHPALQVTFYDAYKLYLDGEPIGSAGNLDRHSFALDAIRTFPVPVGTFRPASSTITLQVANRLVITNSGPINGLITGDFALQVGDASVLDAFKARAVLSRATHYFGSAACFGVVGVMAMMLLVLYFYDRSRREFLLLSVTCLSLSALRLNELATAAYLPYPVALCLFVVFAANVALTFTLYQGYFALANRKPGAFILTLVTLTCIFYFPNLFDVVDTSISFAWLDHLNVSVIRPLSLIFHVVLSCSVFAAFWPYSQIPRRARPLALLCMLWALTDLLWFLAEITAIPVPGIPNIFKTWGVPLIEARAFTTAGVITALLALLFRDQRRATLERAALAAELEAARVVQQVLIPEEIPRVPGLRIESVYKPASEVGGDFFQIVAIEGSGALIVIGDVSGKGMPAAMTVSLLVGTFRTLAHYSQSPGEILSAMNQRMLARSSGGFTTCLVLRVDSDGTLTAANAGHLAPYINGKELALENGLPLGLAAESQYSEATSKLAESASLTLITDGVIEARSTSGELFGFDRTANISTQPANAIAHAAQAHGQEDDITVLTLNLVAVEVAHA